MPSASCTVLAFFIDEMLCPDNGLVGELIESESPPASFNAVSVADRLRLSPDNDHPPSTRHLATPQADDSVQSADLKPAGEACRCLADWEPPPPRHHPKMAEHFTTPCVRFSRGGSWLFAPSVPPFTSRLACVSLTSSWRTPYPPVVSTSPASQKCPPSSPRRICGNHA